ncbi:mannosyltransferase family protein [Bailinhaonella thermotolerans]|uniref:Glycosyltransferase RgtA/B/C/D-like domain-containing protein n=1 Tax=Bailinhaonella thermotolerans TaxID=1070861 RepID=A0A3A4BD49_9ACTN|nr:mannosyltransferase family protein [Bailinhaonella thermotolerans]RJL32128.1 hypothetical protein D5H75_17090 [Bailinhaonella thermotolerans]
MRTADRSSLVLWLASRAGLVLLATAGLGLIYAGQELPSLRDRLGGWDARLLIEIARFGYDGDPAEKEDPGLPAFFPGMPLMLRLVELITRDYVLAGVLISLVAGAIAMVALSRLGEFEGPEGTGPRAVFALLLAPPAVFLLVGYSEALFLAFAIPAWLAMRRAHWTLAVVLAAGASCVRITGLFLACALVVEYYVWAYRGNAEPGGWPRIAARSALRTLKRAHLLIVPFLPLAAYSAYQFLRTGDLLAWKTAQEAGWGRRLVPPWEAWETSWNAAFTVNNQFTWAFRMELAAAVIGVIFTLWLLYARRWGEFTYVGLQVLSLVISSYYLSIPRSALLWWPLYLLIGRAGVRHPWVLAAYALVAGPLMVADALTFFKGAWAG